ncbi:MAG: NAD metabolism ATPase/kinase [Bacteroidetes bacterium GWA2_30_7]|nr:MAG: NAD metabolism ATPase/kinase [Bacteroidetes bacterium GWA2_30_7]
MFTQTDKTLLSSKNIDIKQVEEQIQFFSNGFPFMDLVKPATINDGILQLSEVNLKELIDIFENSSNNLERLKFVPASGAASRMFKSLYSFIEIYEGERKGYDDFMSTNGLRTIMQFAQKIKNFAFYNDLKEVLHKQGKDIDKMILMMDYVGVIEAILKQNGLNYSNLPKALLQFHKYPEKSRTSLEEHLVEGAFYARNNNKVVKIHFTVSNEHKQLFINLVNNVKSNYEKLFNVTFEITYSEQKNSTDTIAVDINNIPFRNSDGSLLFRPGGHGALIENLNDLNSDIIFIKNIDNVVPDRLKQITSDYKKALAGLLIKEQNQIFDYINEIETNNDLSDYKIKEIELFLNKQLNHILIPEFSNFNKKQKVEYLYSKLNRPIKVCGMVKNEGEPGGGPFWSINNDKSISLQIVESSQIDMNNAEQFNIFQKSTHFNPVDLVCGVKNYKGKKFNLLNYIDKNTGFISKKSKDGKDLKALELPGLWNGATSDWNTIFVEVPLITFNPVKTIDDLLRPEHQS